MPTFISSETGANFANAGQNFPIWPSLEENLQQHLVDLQLLQGNKARERDGALELCSGFVYKQLEKKGFNILYASKIGPSTDAALRASCSKVLKSDDVNWNKEVIWSQHWSKGNRENMYDLPDRVCREQCVHNLKKSASEWQSSKQRRWLQLSSRLSFHLVK